MQIEEPPKDKPYETPEGERRGLLIVNTGDGKGKSTAAFGLALRASGRGKNVKIYQFMKVPSARFGEHFLVVCDEITYPLVYGWLDLQDVLETLRNRPKEVHVCLTGRRCPQEIVDLADTVTEMRPVKHAFDAGIPAQRGIED